MVLRDSTTSPIHAFKQARRAASSFHLDPLFDPKNPWIFTQKPSKTSALWSNRPHRVWQHTRAFARCFPLGPGDEGSYAAEAAIHEYNMT